MSESEKNAPHLAAGSECPKAQDNLLRIYSMHYCPYCQRVRSILKFKGIDSDSVNINLRMKPNWFYAISPLGKVPAIQKDGETLYESIVICEYLNEVYPDPPLHSSDPWKKALDKGLIETFGTKVVGPFHKVFTNPQDPEEIEFIAENVNEGLELFEAELEKRNTLFFFGDSPGMLDFALFPWFERFKIIKEIFTDLNILSQDRFPKMNEYAKAMNQIEAASSCNPDFADHVHFIKSHLEGLPDFDIGIN